MGDIALNPDIEEGNINFIIVERQALFAREGMFAVPFLRGELKTIALFFHLFVEIYLFVLQPFFLLI